jgi:hypothetical protein
MSEILTFTLICSAILGYSLYHAWCRIAQLEHSLKESEKQFTEADISTVISEADLRKRTIAVYWKLRTDDRHETGLYVERDPTGENHDCITERYERELDEFGRCVREWKHTDCHGMILRSEYEYPEGPTDEPLREIYFDEHGAKEIWIDVLLDGGGRTIAYIRNRRSNELKDVALYERDPSGVLRKKFECGGVMWPHSLKDVPAKFHSELPPGGSFVTEYSYTESTPPNPKFPPRLHQIKRGSNIKEIELHNGSPRQILETAFGRVKEATHFFPNQDSAVLTVILRRNTPRVEVQIDLTRSHHDAVKCFVDVTAKSKAQQGGANSSAAPRT